MRDACELLKNSFTYNTIQYILLTLLLVIIVYINFTALCTSFISKKRRFNIFYLLLCSNYVSNIIGASCYTGNEMIGIQRDLNTTCFSHWLEHLQLFALYNVVTMVSIMSIIYLNALRNITRFEENRLQQRNKYKFIIFSVWVSNAAWTTVSIVTVNTKFVSKLFRYAPFIFPQLIIVVCYVWTYVLLRKRVSSTVTNRDESIRSIQLAKSIVIYIFMTFVIANILIMTGISVVGYTSGPSNHVIRASMWLARSGFMLFFSTEAIVFFVKDNSARKYLYYLCHACKRVKVQPATTNTETEF